jgi:hypothetical protein
MLTRRRAGELAEELLGAVRAMDRDDVVRRWALPERGGSGPEVAELYDEASDASYVRSVTASLTRTDTVVVVVGMLPAYTSDNRRSRWLPRRLSYALAFGPRWVVPVSRNLVLS